MSNQMDYIIILLEIIYMALFYKVVKKPAEPAFDMSCVNNCMKYHALILAFKIAVAFLTAAVLFLIVFFNYYGIENMQLEYRNLPDIEYFAGIFTKYFLLASEAALFLSGGLSFAVYIIDLYE